MKAYVHQKGTFAVREMSEPVPESDEVLVDIYAAGLNRRDVALKNRLDPDGEPLIIGSDGAGVIAETGSDVTAFQPGDEVIINPSLRWQTKSVAPPEGFDILGMPDHGTFAEKIAIHADQVEPKPAHLSWEEAAVVALSGLTGYRALVTKGEVDTMETIFVPGAGSGVATFLIQFCRALDKRVITSSRSHEKQIQAKHIGADKTIPTDSDWQASLKNETIDLVIDSVGRQTFNRSLDILKKGGRMVVFGATTEDTVTLDLRHFFYGQYQLLGSTMGSREELREMLALMDKHQMYPVMDTTFSLDEADKAFKHLEASEQFGKVALRIQS